MTPRLPVASIAVLSAASTASKPELQKIVFAVADVCRRPLSGFCPACGFFKPTPDPSREGNERIVAVCVLLSLGGVGGELTVADHRSNVIRLNSRASSALSACGCTSPIACNSLFIWRCPAFTTRGFAWPAAATPKAAVKSRYFLPSASQTCTPRARFHTIGQEPSG